MATVILPVLVVLALSGVERAKATKAEFDKLQGEWVLVSIRAGDQREAKRDGKTRIAIKGDIRDNYPCEVGSTFDRIRLDPTRSPKRLDLVAIEPPRGRYPRGSIETYGGVRPGVYHLDGDTLTYCYSFGSDPPTSVDPKGPHQFVLIYQRAKK